MAQGSPTLVIVGYGHSGRGVVDELVQRGTAGWRRILVLDERPAGGRTARRSPTEISIHFGVRATMVDVAQRRVVAGGVAISYDALVLALGERRHVELATAAGIACRDGIVVDSAGRTSAPRVYALGGCADRSVDIAALAVPLSGAAITTGDRAEVPSFGAAPPSDLLSLLVETAAPASAWSDWFRPALSALEPERTAPVRGRAPRIDPVLQPVAREASGGGRPRRPARSLRG